MCSSVPGFCLYYIVLSVKTERPNEVQCFALTYFILCYIQACSYKFDDYNSWKLVCTIVQYIWSLLAKINLRLLIVFTFIFRKTLYGYFLTLLESHKNCGDADFARKFSYNSLRWSWYGFLELVSSSIDFKDGF